MAATNSFGRAARRFANGVVWVFWGGPRAAIRWLVQRGSNLLAVLWLCGLAVFIGTVAVRARATYLAEARQRKDDPVQPKPTDAGVQRAVLVVADVEDAEAVMARRLQDVEGMEADLTFDDGGTFGPMDGGALATLRALKALAKVRGAASPAEVAQMKALLATELGSPGPGGAPVDAFAALQQDDVDVVFVGDGGLVGFLERNKNKARRRLDDPQTLALVAQQLSGEDIQTAPTSTEASVPTAPTTPPVPGPATAPTNEAPPPVAQAPADAGELSPTPTPTTARRFALRDVGNAVLAALLQSDLVRAPPAPEDAGGVDGGLADGGLRDAGVLQTGRGDAGLVVDAGAPDAGVADAGRVVDAGAPDAGRPDGGVVLDAGVLDGGTSRLRRPKVTR